VLEPKDDFRHALPDRPHTRESLFYNLLLPGEGLLVMFYTWVDGQDRAGYLFAVVGDDNERLVFSAADGLPVGERNFDDWEVGGLRVRHAEALRTAELSFAGDDVSYTATFTALHEPFSYHDNEDGCPDFVADDRFEQSGRVTGGLTIGDRTIAFDTMAHRDHSWGTRDWDTIQDWKWISAQAQDGVTFNAMLLHARGENWHNGYVSRGGELSAIVDVSVKADYDANWWQTGGEIVIRDAGGGVTSVSAERFALFRFEAGERIVMHEAGCTGTIDGVPALVHLEAGWDRSYAELQAARVRALSAPAPTP
jgi:hypothetical protein